MSTHFCCRIASDYAEVAEMARKLRCAWTAMGVSEEESITLEICIVEAVNNAIEHAYGGRAGHFVDVVTRLSGSTLVTEVRDNGAAMKVGLVQSAETPDFDPLDIPALPEGGMGLGIMKQVMDDVSYETRSSDNALILSKTIRLADGHVPAPREKDAGCVD